MEEHAIPIAETLPDPNLKEVYIPQNLCRIQDHWLAGQAALQACSYVEIGCCEGIPVMADLVSFDLN